MINKYGIHSTTSVWKLTWVIKYRSSIQLVCCRVHCSEHVNRSLWAAFSENKMKKPAISMPISVWLEALRIDHDRERNWRGKKILIIRWKKSSLDSEKKRAWNVWLYKQFKGNSHPNQAAATVVEATTTVNEFPERIINAVYFVYGSWLNVTLNWPQMAKPRFIAFNEWRVRYCNALIESVKTVLSTLSLSLSLIIRSLRFVGLSFFFFVSLSGGVRARSPRVSNFSKQVERN